MRQMTIRFIHFTAIFLLAANLQSQIPNLQIKDTLGTYHNLQAFLQSDRNYALIFWSVQDPPSQGALAAYDTIYSKWNTKNFVELLAISIDDSTMHANVLTYKNQQGWDYNIAYAKFSDVNLAFGIISIPHIYLIDKSQNIVYSASGWVLTSILDQKINQFFPTGVSSHNSQNGFSVYTAGKQIIIQNKGLQKQFSVRIYDLLGRKLYGELIAESAGETRLNNNLNLPENAMVLVEIEDESGRRFTSKILIQ